MNTDIFFEQFDLITTAPNGVARLREMILDLAVRGQLVEQRDAEEPARKLLEKIRHEKKRISGEKGKAKLFDDVAPIDEIDAPFAIPENWVWTSLGEISTNVHYGYTALADRFKKDVRLLRITDIQNGKVDWESVPGCEIKEKEIGNYELQNGDLLIARTGGTIGKSFLVKNVSVRAVFASYLIRVVPSAEMFPEFVKLYLESSIYWTQLYAKSMGTGQPNVNGTSLRSLVLPLPPLEEQKRIVEKVEELMRLCNKLENLLEQRQMKSSALLSSLAAHAV